MSCRSGTIVGESIFGVALVPSLGTLGLICSTPGFYHFIRSLFKRPARPLPAHEAFASFYHNLIISTRKMTYD